MIIFFNSNFLREWDHSFDMRGRGRFATGRRLADRYVRRTIACQSLRHCEELCAQEEAFLCEGFNFRHKVIDSLPVTRMTLPLGDGRGSPCDGRGTRPDRVLRLLGGGYRRERDQFRHRTDASTWRDRGEGRCDAT
ncbi:hypothetical protein J6590_072703 [Homalodisca vitripennis]|nr:hypothetical protein J6590_072703 [Homalodisca vitripennis]